MTICKYFLQGNCRFGDRCRFEHTEKHSYNYNNRYENQHERYSRQDEYNNYQHNNQYRNRNFEVDNRYNANHRNYSPDRYSDHYDNYSPQRYASDHGSDYNRYNQGYEQSQRYSEASHRRTQQYSNNYQSENTYGQNRYRWLADEYVQERHQKEQKKSYTSESYSTSTPKAKALNSFSFKVPESEIKKGTFLLNQVDEQDQLHAELVKEEAKSWELGGLWPFSCYFPCPSKHGFPGFSDISPEELRYAAYKSEENNLYESYVKSVNNALEQISQLRSQLQVPTPQLLNTLRRIWNGEDLSSTPTAAASIPYIQCEEMATDIMDTPSVPSPSNAAASFSFKTSVEPGISVKSSVAAFSFKTPSSSETKPTISVSGGDADIYTPLEKLTDEEKEQFSASTFVLGKIPTKPPPQELCV